MTQENAWSAGLPASGPETGPTQPGPARDARYTPPPPPEAFALDSTTLIPGTDLAEAQVVARAPERQATALVFVLRRQGSATPLARMAVPLQSVAHYAYGVDVPASFQLAVTGDLHYELACFAFNENNHVDARRDYRFSSPRLVQDYFPGLVLGFQQRPSVTYVRTTRRTGRRSWGSWRYKTLRYYWWTRPVPKAGPGWVLYKWTYNYPEWTLYYRRWVGGSYFYSYYTSTVLVSFLRQPTTTTIDLQTDTGADSVTRTWSSSQRIDVTGEAGTTKAYTFSVSPGQRSHVRARMRGSDGHVSAWSQTLSFTPKVT